MDFIASLLTSQGHFVSMVIIDRFFKAGHFGTLPSHFSAFQAAELFAKIVCKLYGLPKSIITERDLVFVNKSWSTLIKLHDTN